jgi:hypothetical protein
MSVVAWLGAAVLAAVAGAYLWPRVLLDPLFRRMLHPAVRVPRALPEGMAGHAEDVTVPGPTMPFKAWLVRPEIHPDGGEGLGRLAVFIHGWSSDAGRMAPLARHVLDAGVSCLLVDLPGHGRTGRTATYNAVLMVEDLRALADYIAGRGDLVQARVAILGYSFGGIGAIVSAVNDARWAAVVVMATPMGPMQATEIYLEGKGIPARRLRKPLHRAATRVVGVDPNTFAGSHHLPSLRVPALFVHGTRDEVVPHEHAESLYAAAPRGMAELVLVDGAGHDGLLGDPEAGRRVAAFLARVLSATPA